MKSVILVVAGIVAAGLGLSAPAAVSQPETRSPGQQPAQKQPMAPGSMSSMMQQCRQAHTAMAGAVDQALAAVKSARQSNDPQKMREALGEAERHLTAVQGQMATCSRMMDGMMGGCGGMGDGMMQHDGHTAPQKQ